MKQFKQINSFFLNCGLVIAFLMMDQAWGQEKLTPVSTAKTNANPDISVNMLMLGRSSNLGNSDTAENPNGFFLQEMEMRYTSNIDAYFRGDATLAIHKEADEYHLAPEEVFVETLAIPSVTFRIGKFYALMDRHNHLHTHSFPFVDRPLLHESILGEEGLNEVGVAAAYLVPTPWYMEVVAQGFSATNEGLFNSSSQDDIASVWLLKNLWELSQRATLEANFAYGNGRNAFNGLTQFQSYSLTYKWRPIEKSVYQSFLWTVQFLQADREDHPTDSVVGGLTSWAQWQFSRRWWLQGRTDYLGLPKGSNGVQRKNSLLAGFVPTEFSSLRLQYDRLDIEGQDEAEQRYSLQLNVSMGSHPAHSY